MEAVSTYIKELGFGIVEAERDSLFILSQRQHSGLPCI